MNSIFLIGVGVVVGTFIPMPQQQVVRNIAGALWSWAKTKVGNIAF